jgi:hypothetical protein
MESKSSASFCPAFGAEKSESDETDVGDVVGLSGPNSRGASEFSGSPLEDDMGL